jgi:hypothetical protein
MEGTAMPNYVVIENTPGYMPDDDDPYVTDDLESAKRALAESVERLTDFHDENDETYEMGITEDGMSAYVVEDRPHALGRVFEILETADRILGDGWLDGVVITSFKLQRESFGNGRLILADTAQEGIDAPAAGHAGMQIGRIERVEHAQHLVGIHDSHHPERLATRSRMDRCLTESSLGRCSSAKP